VLKKEGKRLSAYGGSHKRKSGRGPCRLTSLKMGKRIQSYSETFKGKKKNLLKGSVIIVRENMKKKKRKGD